jgi:hypothetical protein
MTIRKSSVFDIKKVIGVMPPFAKFINEYYNEMVDTLNDQMKKLSLRYNFPSSIHEDLEIEAGQTIKIYHRLGVSPLYRIILRNSGDGAITDGEFNDTFIELTNRGSITAKISVAILRS